MMKFAAALATCVALVGAQGAPKMSVVRKNVEVSLPAGKAFQVSCPAADSVACSGDLVEVVDGKCQAKEAQLLGDEIKQIIADALQKQFDDHDAAVKQFSDELEAARSGTIADLTGQIQVLDDAIGATGQKLNQAKSDLPDTAAKIQSDFEKALDAPSKAQLAVIAELAKNADDVKKGFEDFQAQTADCLAAGAAGYDLGASACIGASTTGHISCMQMWLKNKDAGTERFLFDGLYKLTISTGKTVETYCDFTKRAGESSPGWTLAAVISRYSRKHMHPDAYGKLTPDGPAQPKPWKLSNKDINTIVKANGDFATFSAAKPCNKNGFVCLEGNKQFSEKDAKEKCAKSIDCNFLLNVDAKGKNWRVCKSVRTDITGSVANDGKALMMLKDGSSRHAYKFGCSQVSNQKIGNQGQHYKGYQYFQRKCVFNANRRVDNYNGRACHSWAPSETSVQLISDGYADSNDCGLGGHHAHGTMASYGWHYCSSNGINNNVKTQPEKQNPSANTGCGHNYRYSQGHMTSGDGTLWIR